MVHQQHPPCRSPRDRSRLLNRCSIWCASQGLWVGSSSRKISHPGGSARRHRRLSGVARPAESPVPIGSSGCPRAGGARGFGGTRSSHHDVVQAIVRNPGSADGYRARGPEHAGCRHQLEARVARARGIRRAERRAMWAPTAEGRGHCTPGPVSARPLTGWVGFGRTALPAQPGNGLERLSRLADLVRRTNMCHSPGNAMNPGLHFCRGEKGRRFTRG